MRFLIDNALSPAVARLCSSGHDAAHVRNYGLQDAEDGVILNRARDEDRFVVSADSDFAMLLALSGQDKPPFILIREAEVVRAEDCAALLIRSLPLFERELETGCVVTFRRGMIRLRKLPFGAAD